MKKTLLFLSAIASMLFATSCSQEDDFAIVADGTEVAVSFSLTQPEISTRAYSDGETATTLTYAVYEADSQTPLITSEDSVTFSGKQANLTLNLVKGKSYNILFWADAKGAPYTFDDENQTITVDYANALCNEERRDAFFASVKALHIDGSSTQKVTMTRPFAQLNLGATDTAAAADVDFVATKTQVVVKSYATLNLLSGEVSDESNVTFALAAIPGVDEVFPATGVTAQYLAMNYLLVNTKATVDVEFTVSNGSHAFTNTYSNVPVQRNYRTNIYGSLLTDATDFNITLDPIYSGVNNNDLKLPVRINDVYYKTIQDAVNAAQDGDVIKVSTGTYQEVVKVAEGKNITLEAAGPNVMIAGLNLQQNYGSTAVSVKDITFDNSIASANWFTGTGWCAPCVGAWGGNLSFENCTFIVDGATDGRETGVMTWNSVKESVIELSFNHCVFEGKENHKNARAMQIYGYANMTVDNCTFNTYKDYTLKYVAQEGNVATFNNNIVNHSENFVELGSSVYPGNNYTVNIKNTTLGLGVHAYVIANNENQTVNVEGSISEIAEGLILNADGTYTATSNAGIEAAMDLNEKNIVVALNNDVTIDTEWNGTAFGGDQTETITIDGNSKTLTFNLKDSDRSNVTVNNDAKLIIKNATIASTGYNSGHWSRNGINFNCSVELKNVVSEAIILGQNAKLNNITINENSGAYSIWVMANGQTVDINGLTINAGDNDSRAIAIKDEDVTNVKKVTLNVTNAEIASAKKAAILVTSTAGANITLNNVDITRVADDNVNAVWVDTDRADYTNLVTVNGGTKIVEP